MKQWDLSEKRENRCNSAKEFIEYYENELIQSKIQNAHRKIPPSLSLLSNLEIEMFFIGSVNISLFDHAMKYYKEIIARVSFIFNNN